MLGRRAFYIFLFLVFFAFHGGNWVRAGGSFATTSGTHFVMNGRPFYLNGFNAYWLMHMASDPSERGKVTSAFQEASAHGMTLARTWAFSDGGDRPLQYKPGSYNEDMFKGLDFVISEARKYGVYLILSLVNNYENFGGRQQYVQWAREQGIYLSSDDDFYRNAVVKGYYKNHIKTILTRINSFTGVAYKDDPTIFAWELMNEPRCQSDLSGNTIQDWIKEMAAHLKSIDSNHLLEVGIEGFYGESMPDRKQFNPGYEIGTDFISNNQIPGIDFATIHAYPDQWIPNSNEQAQSAFLQSWIQAHLQDANTVLRKPILFTEFGKSSRIPGYTTSVRDNFLGTVYNTVYASARSGGPCGGGLFWQLLVQGMDNFRDGYEVIMAESPSTANIIAQQSHKLSALN
ncbi:mannan endo-1,4-beta-mannosidase 1-like [Magnolia sinica]|uniref:mannan endo-1,4-beta-mannosidase 1-like n=1 Tax=Magnolia sinica TaxID=86752 RepID=UPI0026588B0F|nr:mannan endo-1,4-beta-mannosidase 1-like [Magnolia sinica]